MLYFGDSVAGDEHPAQDVPVGIPGDRRALCARPRNVEPGPREEDRVGTGCNGCGHPCSSLDRSGVGKEKAPTPQIPAGRSVGQEGRGAHPPNECFFVTKQRLSHHEKRGRSLRLPRANNGSRFGAMITSSLPATTT